MRILCTFALLCLCLALRAQQSPVLLHIDGKAVSLAEFEQACQRHGMGKWEADDDLRQARLRWFVTLKLKAAAAEAARLDTLPDILKQTDAYRATLLKHRLADPAGTEAAARKRYRRMVGETPSGRVLVSQVYRYLPQHVTSYSLRRIEAQMDSISRALRRGADFNECVRLFSDEKHPFWVSRLQTLAEFEEVVFSLREGEISSPFFTPQGIHIVRVLKREPPPSYETVRDSLIARQTRSLLPSASALETMKRECGFAPDAAGMNELRTYGQTRRTLFTLNGLKYGGEAFALFAAAHPGNINRQLQNFIAKSILDYESTHLERLHPELGLTLVTYRDSLLADALDAHDKAALASDDRHLQAYFKENRSRYLWKSPRYKGIVLHGKSKRAAKKARKFLKKLPEEEQANAVRLLFKSEQSDVVAEIGLFAPGDNAYVDHKVFKRAKAAPKNSHPHTLLIGKTMKGPENYAEVYSLVVEDYTRHLEGQRIARLYDRSKVEINQEVLNTVNNQRGK